HVGGPATGGEDGELISVEWCIGEDVADYVPVVGHCPDRCKGRRPWEDRLSATSDQRRTEPGRRSGSVSNRAASYPFVGWRRRSPCSFQASSSPSRRSPRSTPTRGSSCTAATTSPTSPSIRRTRQPPSCCSTLRCRLRSG